MGPSFTHGNPWNRDLRGYSGRLSGDRGPEQRGSFVDVVLRPRGDCWSTQKTRKSCGEAMETAIVDRRRSESLVAHGRQQIQAEFNPERILALHLEYYRDILAMRVLEKYKGFCPEVQLRRSLERCTRKSS